MTDDDAPRANAHSSLLDDLACEAALSDMHFN